MSSLDLVYTTVVRTYPVTVQWLCPVAKSETMPTATTPIISGVGLVQYVGCNTPCCKLLLQTSYFTEHEFHVYAAWGDQMYCGRCIPATVLDVRLRVLRTPLLGRLIEACFAVEGFHKNQNDSVPKQDCGYQNLKPGCKN